MKSLIAILMTVSCTSAFASQGNIEKVILATEIVIGKCQQQEGDQWVEVFVTQARAEAALKLIVVAHDVDTDSERVLTQEVVNSVLQRNDGARGYLSSNLSLTITKKYGRLMGDLQSKAFGISQSTLLCR